MRRLGFSSWPFLGPLALILTGFFTTAYGEVSRPTHMLSGVDVLAASPPQYLHNLRVGLITNRSGITSSGSRTIEIVAERCQLTKIFAPEHGLEGLVAGGENVASGHDRLRGIPVLSLYGKTRRPTKEMLSGLDALVYDIQDAGNRAYTYISTMFNCMEEAAKHKLMFVVLDRPNPLGGNRVEGNVLDPKFKSFVGAAEIPYVYGLTPGELARWHNHKQKLQCNLKVVPLQGWQRNMTMADTGLPWVALSPNVPFVHTPFLLVVTGLVGELQMVSEGLGTDDPFAYMGAPWFDAPRFLHQLNQFRLPGVVIHEAGYTPGVGTYKGEPCRGVHLQLDPARVNLFDTATALMESLAVTFPDKAIFSKGEPSRLKMFDQVCGTDLIRKNLVETGSIACLRKDFAQARQVWIEEVVQAKAILYFEGNTVFLKGDRGVK